MSEFLPLLNRTVKFTAPAQGADAKGKVTHFRQEAIARVTNHLPNQRQVELTPAKGEGDAILFRFEDVQILEVDGLPYEQFLAALEGAKEKPQPVNPVRWNPITRQVLNHQDGVVNEELTKEFRLALKLPEKAQPSEMKEAPLPLPPDLAKKLEAKLKG